MKKISKSHLLKKTASFLLAALLLAGSLTGCGKTTASSEKKAVTLNEVAHSMKCADKSNIESD